MSDRCLTGKLCANQSAIGHQCTLATGHSFVGYLSAEADIIVIDERGAPMNPSSPTTAEMKNIEQLFFEQMKRQTRRSTGPPARLRTFDFQFSDRWISA
jgi:hypothetical protein